MNERVGPSTRICLGATMRGLDPYPVDRCFVRLQRLLGQLDEEEAYCPDIATVGIHFDIDGCLGSSRFVGVRGVRLYKKDGDIGCSLGVPVSAWQGRSTNELRFFLAAHVREAFRRMADRALERGYDLDKERLMRDVEVKLWEFLQDEEEYGPSVGETALRKAVRSFVSTRRLKLALGQDAPSIGPGMLELLSAASEEEGDG